MYGVLRTTVAGDAVPALIADVHAWFPPGIRWTWETSAMDRPTDLSAHLAAAGFSRLAVLPAMTLPLSAALPRRPSPMDVAEVLDPSDLEAWLTVRDANHPLDTATRTAWLRPAPRDPSFRQVVARDPDGRPVGSMSIFVDGDTAGLYHVDVVPSARGQGVGAAMTGAALDVAATYGARIAVLTATDPGKRLYGRLGFEPVPGGSMESWIHTGAAAS
jgi:GNAT superfamily N-acetyltransferase